MKLPIRLEPLVLYELPLTRLLLEGTSVSGPIEIDMSETVRNGRGSYVMFERLVRDLFGLRQAKGSDHVDPVTGLMYEQKSYVDPEHPAYKVGQVFQTSASSTFGANNVYRDELGPLRLPGKSFRESGTWEAALKICQRTGYNKNDGYIYTNTGGFTMNYPFRCMMFPKQTVLSLLSKDDPRFIRVEQMLSMARQRLPL